jgi:hypothetical protein
LQNEEDQQQEIHYISTKMVYIGACEHQLCGDFEGTDDMFKSILIQEAPNGLEQVMFTVNMCVKGGRRMKRIMYQEDGQLFLSRIAHICCNDADFVSQLPNGFKKHFFRYKNSVEGNNHLKYSL